jgi:hypothetical protein
LWALRQIAAVRVFGNSHDFSHGALLQGTRFSLPKILLAVAPYWQSEGREIDPPRCSTTGFADRMGVLRGFWGRP